MILASDIAKGVVTLETTVEDLKLHAATKKILLESNITIWAMYKIVDQHGWQGLVNCLLDKDDPSKVIARSREPLIAAAHEDREGYVPNVVYSCGGLVHDRTLLLPYGVADTLTSFATAPVDDVLAMLS